jgi:hypothetical protein
MTQLEERLRRGLKDYSERIRPESLPPLSEPPRRRRRAVRWLAPAAAALAAVGVIAGVSLARQQSPGSPFLSSPVYVPAGPGMPPYYVTVYETYVQGRNLPITKAEVHDSATGKKLTSLTVPTLVTQDGTNGVDVTAAGNDRTFVIYQTATISARDRVAWLYLLQVAANGRSAKLSRMRIDVPKTLAVDYLALSPDGRMLAMQEQYCPNAGGCVYTGIRIVTIRTGAVRTWTTRKNGAPFDVSWAGNTRVAFLWEGQGAAQGYRLLDLTGSGGNLLASKRIATPPPVAVDGGAIPDALVTANGRTVITSTVSPGTGTVTAKIIELNAKTGKQLRVLSTVTGSAKSLQYCQVVSLAPSGLHLLVSCPYFGRLDGSKFKPLPGFPSPSHSGISQQSTGAW